MNGSQAYWDILHAIGIKSTCLSVISYAEVMAKADTRTRLLFNQTFTQPQILPLDVNISHLFKELADQFPKKGKGWIPDALIAATAQVHEVPLLTADGGFRQIPGLELHPMSFSDP